MHVTNRMRKTLKCCEHYQNVTQRHEVTNAVGNGADKLALRRAATNFESVKHTASTNCNKAKQSEMGYVHKGRIMLPAQTGGESLSTGSPISPISPKLYKV